MLNMTLERYSIVEVCFSVLKKFFMGGLRLQETSISS